MLTALGEGRRDRRRRDRRPVGPLPCTSAGLGPLPVGPLDLFCGAERVGWWSGRGQGRERARIQSGVRQRGPCTVRPAGEGESCSEVCARVFCSLALCGPWRPRMRDGGRHSSRMRTWFANRAASLKRQVVQLTRCHGWRRRLSRSAGTLLSTTSPVRTLMPSHSRRACSSRASDRRSRAGSTLYDALARCCSALILAAHRRHRSAAHDQDAGGGCCA